LPYYRCATPPSFFSTDDFTISNESDCHQLSQEREEMLLSASSRDGIGGVIDASLLEGDDDMEFDADNAQWETKAVEAVTAVLQEYMAGVLGKIKQQIDSYGRPNCCANGTFWERPKDPLF
jgi:hypothetical protein